MRKRILFSVVYIILFSGNKEDFYCYQRPQNSCRLLRRESNIQVIFLIISDFTLIALPVMYKRNLVMCVLTKSNHLKCTLKPMSDLSVVIYLKCKFLNRHYVYYK